MIFKHPGLYIDKSRVHGWGVFTKEDIKEGDLIEEAPVVHKSDLGGTINLLHPYLMPYNRHETGFRYFIPTGYSILLNHSDEENVEWEINYETDVSLFYAAKNIKADEELFINYNHWKIQ